MAIAKLQLSQLFSTYGALLTSKQQDIVAMYCDCDCTLTEIASENGISRQCVRDTITKAEQTLTKYESELHLCDFVSCANVLLQANDDEMLLALTKQFVEKE